MATLASHEAFDPDELDTPVVGIQSAIELHDSGLHTHRKAQLLFVSCGCVRIKLAQQLCLLPPWRIAWIPALCAHQVISTATVGYRSIYLDSALPAMTLTQAPQILQPSRLLWALLERMAAADFATDWAQPAASAMLTLCLDELAQAPTEPTLLALPQDRRLSSLALDTLPPALNQLAQKIGASERTLGRIFQRDTGMSYQQWRQQWRFLKAIELMARGLSTSAMASELGFASDSALIAFFRHHSGFTPKAYLKRSAARRS